MIAMASPRCPHSFGAPSCGCPAVPPLACAVMLEVVYLDGQGARTARGQAVFVRRRLLRSDGVTVLRERIRRIPGRSSST